MRDRLHDEVVEVIADELAERTIHLSNQSVASQVRNGAFEGLTLSESEDWNEYLDYMREHVDEIQDDIVWEDDIPDPYDLLDRWGDRKVA